jgi:hypothetical protein
MFNYNIDDVKSIISQFFMYGSNSNDDRDSSSNQTLLQSSFCEDCIIFRSSHYDTNGYITPYKRSYQPDALSNNNNNNNNDNDNNGGSSSSNNSNGLHCADTLSISIKSMELLAQNPPQGLFESYYSCKNTWLTNLYYAIGIAFGNMQVFSVLLFIIILPICYSCTIYFGITNENELVQRKLDRRSKSLVLISSKSSSSNSNRSSSGRSYTYRGIVDDVFNQYPHRKSSFQDINPRLRHSINLTAKCPDDDDGDNDDDGDGNGNDGCDDDDENENNNDDDHDNNNNDDNGKGNDIEFNIDDTNKYHAMNI